MNNNINKILVTLVVAFGSFVLTSTLVNADVTQKPLAYSDIQQLKLAKLDSLERAVDEHIQLKASDQPLEKISGTITTWPTGWHNFRLLTAYGADTYAWLYQRGHLIGPQFMYADQTTNVTIETTYLELGSINGFDKPDANNQASMLFYETKLDAWVLAHPTWHLDYQVTPIYKGSELVPRQIRLAYVGYNKYGEVKPIKFATSLEKTGNGQATVVTLNNVSANAEINYTNGDAIGYDPNPNPAYLPTPKPAPSIKVGWHKTATGIYYTKSDGSRAKGFYKVGSRLYYFDKDGWQYKNRWFKVGNSNYHVNNSGDVADGFVNVNNHLYYFDNKGKQYKNCWFKNGNKNYHVDSHGYVTKGFVKINGYNYYFDGNGTQFKNRWFNIGRTYHVDSDGYVARGFKTINKHKYFFLKSNGKQVKNKKKYVISGHKYNISKQGYVTPA